MEKSNNDLKKYLSYLWGIIRLNGDTVKVVAADKNATILGFFYMFLYTVFFYFYLLKIWNPYLDAIVKDLNLPANKVVFFVSAEIVFDFVFLLLIHFVASRKSQQKDFWALFRPVSQANILGLISPLFLRIWKILLSYKALRLNYDLKPGQSILSIFWAFILLFLLLSLANSIVLSLTLPY